MDSGRLAGIARHDRPKGPMERLHHVSVTAAEGVHGDFRGGLAATKPGRKRQVSLIDLVFTPSRDTTKEELNEALKAASTGAMKGVLDYTDQPLVSTDFNHQPASSTVDSLETAVLEGKLARVVSWYDNEWGFSNRMIDTAGVMAKFL